MEIEEGVIRRGRNTYPGCQRLFMRGFRFQSSRPKTCRPVADEAPRRTREKTSGTQGIIPSSISTILH